MTTINLKDFYYWYTQDQFIEVSDEVAEVFVSDARHEMAYQRRLSRHKAQYSLDCDDGIEYSACLHEPTPQLGWAKPRPRSGIGQAGRLSPQLPSCVSPRYAGGVSYF